MAAHLAKAGKPEIARRKPTTGLVVVQRQCSVFRGFTTEDCDVFNKDRSEEAEKSPDMLDEPASSVMMRNRNATDKVVAGERQTRRRSKSVGAPGWPIRMLPAYEHTIGEKPEEESRETAATQSSSIPGFVPPDEGASNIREIAAHSKASKTSKSRSSKETKDPPVEEPMLTAMKSLDFPGAGFSEQKFQSKDRAAAVGPRPETGPKTKARTCAGKENGKAVPGNEEATKKSNDGDDKRKVSENRTKDGMKSNEEVVKKTETDKNSSKTERNFTKFDQNSIKTDRNVTKVDKNLHEADQNLIKTDQNLIKTDQNLIKTDQNLMKTDQNLMKTDQNLIKTDQNLTGDDKNLHETNQNSTKTIESPTIVINVSPEVVPFSSESTETVCPKSPNNLFVRKFGAHHGGAAFGVTKKLTRKLSRKLTGRMTKRQRQEMMLEGGEFDEFDAEVSENENNEETSLKSPNVSDDEENGSDDTDNEFETEIVTQLNLERITVDDDACSVDESGGGVLEMNKVHRIANELLMTERAYVKKLYLLDQVFHLKVVLTNREHAMFPENVVPRIFSNIKSIYQFHNDFLLPQLEKRMAEWSVEQRIGDVMRKFAPFLKLYSEYVKNFDCAMKMINFWSERSPRFAKLLTDIQMLPECGHLILQHHMLEPIQRVPRYQLLLKDYIQHLHSDSRDREDTEKALELVTTAASHSNEAMRKIEKFRKLLDVNDRLGGMIDLINPTRELVKEGKMVRISAKDGDHIERYLFLFNDLLLVCQSLPLIIGTKQQFKIKSKMDVEGLEVTEAHNLETPNTFYVKGQQKSIELHTSSAEEKQDWQSALDSVIEQYNKAKSVRKASLRLGKCFESDQLGKRPPVWIKDRETSMCMNCTMTFTTFRRRHHCRGCGHVICGKCSSRKAPLEYDCNNQSRVCDVCYEVLCPPEREPSKKVQTHVSVRSQHQLTHHKKGPVILQVKASDPSVISGYLHISCNKKTWLRRWFVVHDNFVLYSFKAHQDIIALTTLPLPGYQVVPVDVVDGIDRENTFKVFHVSHQSKIYYLQTDDEAGKSRWMEVLQKVSQLELPSPEKKPETPPVAHASSVPRDDVDNSRPSSE